MVKKESCSGLWGQILTETKTLTGQILSRMGIKSCKAPVVPCEQVQSKNTPRVAPIPAPGSCPRPVIPVPKVIKTPFYNVGNPSQSSTTSLLLVNGSMTSFMTLDRYGSVYDLATKYETLWEVQLELGEIPNMLSSNLLEPCQTRPWCEPLPSRTKSVPSEEFSLDANKALLGSILEHHDLPLDGLSSQREQGSLHPSGILKEDAYYYHSQDYCPLEHTEWNHPSYSSCSLEEASHPADLFGRLAWVEEEEGGPVTAEAVAGESQNEFLCGMIGPGEEYEDAAEVASATAEEMVQGGPFQEGETRFQNEPTPAHSATATLRRLTRAMSASQGDLRYDRKDSGVFVHDEEEGYMHKRVSFTTSTTSTAPTASDLRSYIMDQAPKAEQRRFTSLLHTFASISLTT